MKFEMGFTLPPKQERARARAVKLEWITLGFLLNDVVLLYFTMGKSQAMKTAWVDNLLSMTPPLVFLVAEKIRHRPPTKRFTYGFHRIVSIAFLISATALFSVGLYLLFESIAKLLSGEHPSIGSMDILGHTLWAGWPMVAVAAWSGISAAILGRMKLPLGPILHNKVIHADASMNKADWLMSAGTIAGVLGIGMGWWWADGLAAALISTDILWDGFTNLRCAFADLLDRVPETVESQVEDPIVARVKRRIAELPWVKDSIVRMHEEGHVFYGEALVIPTEDTGLTGKVDDALKEIDEMDWRIRDFTLTPVRELPDLDSRTVS